MIFCKDFHHQRTLSTCYATETPRETFLIILNDCLECFSSPATPRNKNNSLGGTKMRRTGTSKSVYPSQAGPGGISLIQVGIRLILMVFCKDFHHQRALSTCYATETPRETFLIILNYSLECFSSPATPRNKNKSLGGTKTGRTDIQQKRSPGEVQVAPRVVQMGFHSILMVFVKDFHHQRALSTCYATETPRETFLIILNYSLECFSGPATPRNKNKSLGGTKTG